MFNYTGSYSTFRNYKIIGGTTPGDYDSHRTLFAGPDPANPNRVLVRKLVQTSENVWCLEEARITPGTEGSQPTVHTTMHRLGQFDIQEPIDEKEWNFRLCYKATPSVVGFSLFSRAW